MVLQYGEVEAISGADRSGAADLELLFTIRAFKNPLHRRIIRYGRLPFKHWILERYVDGRPERAPSGRLRIVNPDGKLETWNACDSS